MMRRMPAAPWWKTSVVYQIYPRSFASSSSGVGDLRGATARLPYLQWLGIDAVWLSPIFVSPMADGGYDVSDHCGVDPAFGTLADFDELVDAAHALGIRVLLDWVPNHTSDQHPWFVASRSSRTDPQRDWYLWRDGKDGREPNNWRAAFGGSAWTWDATTAQWYLHLFLAQQPDLNWANPAVEAAMHDVLRFWLDRGVDGFRADVVHLIGKDDALPDQPPDIAHLDLVGVHDHPHTHALLRRIRSVLDGYPGERTMVGEVNLRGASRLVRYYGKDDELPLVFNFALLTAPWDAGSWAAIVQEAEDEFAPSDAWPVWVLSNHDTSRVRTRFGGSEERARVAALVLLTLRGTPFLYQGEELGLRDAHVPASARHDPGGRDAFRAPMPWDASADHGWPATPWLPFAPSATHRNVDVLAENRGSILHLYRELLRYRQTTTCLRTGTWQRLEAPAEVLAFERQAPGERRRVVANFGDRPRSEIAADGAWLVDLDTDGNGRRPWEGRLPACTGAILRPLPDTSARDCPSG